LRVTRVKAVAGVAALLAVAIAVLLAANPAPRVPAPSADVAARSTQPFIVKLHARWCPVCMATKDVWAGIEQTYGSRVRLVVFDFTNERTTEASRAGAARLGLGRVFDDYEGETGTILLVDAGSRTVASALHGRQPLDEFRAAIEARVSRR
jgi:hypothetical protein